MSKLSIIYQQLLELDNYAPSVKVNKLFSQLVDIALSNETNTLNSSQVKNLQLICSVSEYQLESYWTKRIINSSRPDQTLKEFPYFENYQKLTKLEWSGIKSCTNHNSHSIIFLGGGPFPLTAILLAKKYKQKILILEKEKEACSLATNLIKKLKLGNKITIINQDALEFERYHQYNIVFIAALLTNKKNVLIHIKNSAPKTAHILARSSWGMRKILYKPLSKSIQKLFTPVMEVRPQNDIINSFFIFSNQ